MKRITFGLMLLLLSCAAPATDFDHRFHRYGEFVGTHVKNGLLDYAAITENRQELDDAVRTFSDLDNRTLETFSQEQQIAFWINAYNIFTIKAIVDHYPVESIKDISGVWNKLKFKIASQKMTLDNIEHNILRKKFKEPRIHAALVCASISCPELWNKPFTADSLDHQLNLRSLAFVTDSSRNRIDYESGTAHLSKIFKWYGDDFIEKFGGNQSFEYLSDKNSAVLNFISQLLSGDEQSKLAATKLKVRHLDYDWNLNSR